MNKKRHSQAKHDPPTADPLAGLVRYPIVRLGTGQRLYRIVRLFLWEQEAGAETEHRIVTLVQPGGRLELLSFVFRRKAGEPATTTHAARAENVPPESLDRLIQVIVHSANIHPEDVETIDLSHLYDVTEQVRYLQAEDLLDALAHP